MRERPKVSKVVDECEGPRRSKELSRQAALAFSFIVSPVYRDGEQVEYGGGAAEDVAHGPHLAQLRPERPLLADLQSGGDRYY